MVRKRLEQMKRGLCIFLAGAMILSSDVTSFAAEVPQNTLSLTTESNDTPTEAAESADTGETPDTQEEVPSTDNSVSTEDTGAAEEATVPSGQESVVPQTPAEEPIATENVTEEPVATEDTGAAEEPVTPEEQEPAVPQTPAQEIAPVEESVPAEEALQGNETEETTEKTAGEDLLKAGTLTEAGAKIVFDGNKNYVLTDVGATVNLPAYTITYTDKSKAPANAPVMQWVSDDMGVASLNAAAGSVQAIKPGVAYLKLQSVEDAACYARYQVVVRPAAPMSAQAAEVTYNSVKINWSGVTDAEGYIVYRKAEKDSDYTEIAKLTGASATNYTDNKNLLVGTQYAYRVHSYVTFVDENGKTQYAESSNKAQVMAEPQLGQVQITEATASGTDSATIKWNTLEGAAGYTVYRAAGGSSDFKEVKTFEGAVNTYTDTALAAGQTYSYKIAAYALVNGAKVYGKESLAAHVTPIPMAPSLAITSYTSSKVTLGWNAIPGADGYRIYRKASGSDSFKTVTTVKGGSKVSYTDKSVKTGTKYTYKVRAYTNVSGTKVWGEYSQEKSVTPKMEAPQVSVGKITQDSVTISWKKLGGAEGYKILRATSINGKYKKIKTISNTNTLSYTDKGLTTGNTYYYKVYGFCSANGKDVSGRKTDPVAVQIVPEAPTVSTEAAGATAIKLTWNKVKMPSKNSGYYIYQVVDGKDVQIKKCSNKKQYYTINNLTPGQKYTFKVAAYVKNANGEIVVGAHSAPITVSPELKTVTIDSVKATAYQQIEIGWKATEAADEDAYLIYRSTSSKSNYKKIATVTRENGKTDYTYTDSNVSVGKKYYYKIKCTKTLADGKTIKSAYSEKKSAVAAPGVPEIKVKKNTYNSLKISWKKIKGATSTGYVNGYAIYRSTSPNGTYKKIKIIRNGNTSSYVDKGLKVGNTYYYKVRAYCNINNKSVYGDYSPVKSAKVVPEKTTITVKASDYQTVAISWKAVKGCDGYKVYRAEAENGTFKSVKTIKSASTTSYNDSKLTTGKQYYYKVRAYCNNNGKNVYGSYSGIKSAIPVLGKPKNLKAMVADSNQIKVTWDAVPGAETYTILRSTSATGNFKIASEICTTNSFVDANVSNGKTYYYKVFAVRGDVKSEMTDCVAAVAVSMTLSVSEVVVKTGDHVKVSADVSPAGTVMWSSANTQVALVTSTGVVYGLKAGTTTLTANANGVTKTVKVTVKDKLDGRGIEVSEANGKVDFDAIKASGYEYVMLRISNGTTKDKKFETNLKNAKAAGLKVGVTCYAKARSKAEAEKEAYQVLAILNGCAIDYPIVYVMEEVTLLYGLTNTQRSDNVDAFRNVITNVGKKQFILCASYEWLTKYLDTKRLAGVNLWVTNYRDVNLGHGYTGAGNVVMWRYTGQGTVGGVEGNANISISYMVN